MLALNHHHAKVAFIRREEGRRRMSEPPRGQAGDLRALMAEQSKTNEILERLVGRMDKTDAKSDARHTENSKRFAALEASNETQGEKIQRIDVRSQETLSTQWSSYRKLEDSISQTSRLAQRALELSEAKDATIVREATQGAAEGAARGSNEKDKRWEAAMYVGGISLLATGLANMQKIFDFVMSVWGKIDNGMGG